MANIRKFRVVPSLPEKLKPLMKIAKNLWWVWNFEAIELFRRLDVELWRDLEHNPVAFLGAVSQNTLDEAANSESFIAHMERVEEELDWHLNKRSWFEDNCPDYKDAKIAYFSAEFGLHESLPIYSGGLGILAGDHLKSSSELGLPLYGVGLLYRLGYFHQYLTIDGWQQESLPATDFFNIPVNLVIDNNGQPLIIEVELPGRSLYLQIWEVNVGRVKLYLMDANIDQNSKDDRTITDQLYGGDLEMRIKQEIVLGIGGVRLLKALNIEITAYHLNEGHSAFLAIERIADTIKEHKLDFKEALEFVTASNIFTTHTPVPAGIDRFPSEMVDKYLSQYYNKLGLTREQFMGLGRENPFDKKENFCMAILAINTAGRCNGVSKLHGAVSRSMWNSLWPSLPVHEVPIEHITNGIQILSWTSDEMMRLLNRYLGPRWIDSPVNKEIWLNVDIISDSELWRCRERLRERLVAFARRDLKMQLKARGVSKVDIEIADSVLDPEALTIGFARRFATYKRATLILRKMDRLEKLLMDRERPIQIVFAGKAHPKDNNGKELIKHIIHLVRDERFRNKIIFLEDYDINIARYLVQGVDVWLNTPIRPKEASGTSGMKVVPNGGLNISVLDGWWDEAYNGSNGWAIGKGEEYDDLEYQNEVESLSLYEILEEEVLPLFYERGIDGVPKGWVKVIKESMKTLCPQFNTNRMLREYTERFYLSIHENFRELSIDNFCNTKELVQWKNKMGSGWKNVLIRDLQFGSEQEVSVGSKVKVKALINLGELTDGDVNVELYLGDLNPEGEIIEGAPLPMFVTGREDNGDYVYEGQMLCLKSGQFGFTVRIVPEHRFMTKKFMPNMIMWA